MAPTTERRKHRRLSPDRVRVWCVSGEFEELYTTVNFATRLIDLSPEGMGIETTGRLRAGVKMSVEIRFDDLGGALRTPGRIVWAETLKEGAAEVHRAGIKFVGPVDMTKPVREYLEGGNPATIAARRRDEYEILKKKSEIRKQGAGGKKGGALKKVLVTFLLLALLYGGSFAGFVLAGRVDSPGPAVHFRYPVAPDLLSKLYAPLAWALGKAGVDLTPVPPP